MTRKEIEALILKTVDTGRYQRPLLISGGGRDDRFQLAHFFVQALFCSERTEGRPPCNRCSQCRAIRDESHPDFKFIEGAGEQGFLKIDQVRQLKESLNLSPYQAEHRVYLLEVEAIREEAANAFLKVLEEPPKSAVIVLLAPSERQFMPTVLSRLNQLRLPDAEAAVAETDRVDRILSLAWSRPAEIFALAQELSGKKEDPEKLDSFLIELVNSLNLALKLKAGAPFENPPAAVRELADRSRDTAELATLLDEVLRKRQDILRGRVSPRLALEFLLIVLARPRRGRPSP